MADTHETSADIIAEMRRRIAVKMSDAWYTQEEWRKLCDRLEAAWKRERGDCAKMREAAKYVQSTMEGLRDPTDKNNAEFIRIWEIVSAALAAPQRNCDRFGGDYKKLNAAWFDWTGTPDGQNVDGTVKLTFAEWLLAPAQAKEGGAK